MRIRTATSLPAERQRDASDPPGGVVFEARRTGLASFLFAILRPRDARAASVGAETVRVMVGKMPDIVQLRDLDEVEVSDGLIWSHVVLL